MPTFRATTTVDRPPAEVWAVVADYDRDPEWRRGVETMAPSTPGPAVVGTTTDEVLHLGGRTYRNHGQVVDVDPGHRLVWRTLRGADANGSRTVTPTGDGRTEVELVLEVRTHGLERLLEPVLAPMLRKGLQQDLARLTALLESAKDPATT